MKNIMEKIRMTKAEIYNGRYDLRLSDVLEIFDNSPDKFDLITNGYAFGYFQGIRAAKAEMKKKGVKNEQ